MIGGTVDLPWDVVAGRVRQSAASQGWLLTSGGPHAPDEPLVFRHGLGSTQPSAGLVVHVKAAGASSTTVEVTVFRGPVVVDGYQAERLLTAIGAHP